LSFTNRWADALAAAEQAEALADVAPRNSNAAWAAKSLRVELMEKTGKSTNRALLLREMGLVHPRDPMASGASIDLSAWFNASLRDEWVTQLDPRAAMTSLPLGMQKMGGQTFDVRGVVQLAGADNYVSNSRFPNKVEGISIERLVGALHFLHGTVGEINEKDKVIAQYRVRYADGQAAEIPIVYGKDVSRRHFNGQHNGEPAWMGPSDVAKAAWPNNGWQLYLLSWTNSRPNVPVKSIDLVSTMTKSAAFIIAINAEPVDWDKFLLPTKKLWMFYDRN
jgi:hypothetical protein